jgi:pimeloyl-ACP methyl ester carboxylesterase
MHVAVRDEGPRSGTPIGPPLGGTRHARRWHQRPGRLTSLGAAMDAVTSTLTAEDAGPVVIVGHSWGGMVGLRLAVARPELVRGLVLSNTPWVRNHGLTRIGFHAQRALLAVGFPPNAYGRMAARSLIGADYLWAHPDLASQMAARMSAMGRTRIRQTLTSVLLAPHDAVDLLGRTPDPVACRGGRPGLCRRGRRR